MAEGREATLDELRASLESGLPFLEKMCADERELTELFRQRDRAYEILGLLPMKAAGAA